MKNKMSKMCDELFDAVFQGMKWFILANEEIPSMIMAITGRRGRPPNPDKEKPRTIRGVRGAEGRRPGRPPKTKMIDLLTKVDAKLLQRLEAKGDRPVEYEDVVCPDLRSSD